jgi:hypothetical protein
VSLPRIMSPWAGDGALGREMKPHRGPPYCPRRRESVFRRQLPDHKGLGVGTEMPLDGDGTMVGDKITIALAP